MFFVLFFVIPVVFYFGLNFALTVMLGGNGKAARRNGAKAAGRYAAGYAAGYAAVKLASAILRATK